MMQDYARRKHRSRRVVGKYIPYSSSQSAITRLIVSIT